MPFAKGKSGNPCGRPKVNELFRNRARKFVDEHVLDAWIEEVEQRGREWFRCSELLAAYGYGKPTQPLEHSGEGGAPLSIVVKFV